MNAVQLSVKHYICIACHTQVVNCMQVFHSAKLHLLRVSPVSEVAKR